MKMNCPNFGGVSWAVFNCRGPDKRSGREAVLKKFGQAGWKKVLTINRTGIMAMFQTKPIPETLLYAKVVGELSDARYGKKKAKESPTQITGKE